ncbi:RNA polymerase sigma-70 factor (ECF subfamily) [Kribbella steppae]|uniref:RNA polymerase sigma-70 factor (ECF subfamily) n=1 Tax=Kribbella steppae TaxID=2512223 RepID=A0A4R2GSG6_9ACTN|nr:RNA polymerase sigma-70 factor [Kribbella steppae]TCO12867.1 RNA polymerase sigma-70 factor (ECF subfamily) [Kribbella steppae]
MTRKVDGRGDSETFEELRPLMFSIAYRMLASVTEAEDVVQEAFVRHQQALDQGVDIASPKAYLSTVVTRLSIDLLRSAVKRRESYVGQWLPEPLLTDDDADPQAHAEQADSLSMAFLLVLERLNPVERAVFLLHDVFGYGYDEIAAVVGKSETNCRQLAARARRHVKAEKPRFQASAEQGDALAARFFAAFTQGDLDGLVGMLAKDAVAYGDGGGKAPQWSLPVVGADRVARLFAGMSREVRTHRITVELHQVNGQPGAVLRTPDGQLVNVFVLDIVDGVVQTVRSVINPDKLRHLGPVADVRAIRDEHRVRRD